MHNESIHPLTQQLIQPFTTSSVTHPSSHSSAFPPVHPKVNLSIHPGIIHPSIYLSIIIYIHPPLHPFLGVPIYPSIPPPPWAGHSVGLCQLRGEYGTSLACREPSLVGPLTYAHSRENKMGEVAGARGARELRGSCGAVAHMEPAGRTRGLGVGHAVGGALVLPTPAVGVGWGSS